MEQLHDRVGDAGLHIVGNIRRGLEQPPGLHILFELVEAGGIGLQHKAAVFIETQVGDSNHIAAVIQGPFPGHIKGQQIRPRDHDLVAVKPHLGVVEIASAF